MKCLGEFKLTIETPEGIPGIRVIKGAVEITGEHFISEPDNYRGRKGKLKSWSVWQTITFLVI